jgi:hypothetical protein
MDPRRPADPRHRLRRRGRSDRRRDDGAEAPPHPESETLVTFALASLGGALAAGAVGVIDVSLLRYAAYYCSVNGAIAQLIHQRRRCLHHTTLLAAPAA